MKISLKDLKKAIAWVEANTNAEMIIIDFLGNKTFLKTTDKYDKTVEITIYDEETKMMPTVTSTDRLR